MKIHDVLSCLEILLIKALRKPPDTNGIRSAVWGHDRPFFIRRLCTASGCLKTTARCGLMRTMLLRKFEKEETQREDKTKTV